MQLLRVLTNLRWSRKVQQWLHGRALPKGADGVEKNRRWNEGSDKRNLEKLNIHSFRRIRLTKHFSPSIFLCFSVFSCFFWYFWCFFSFKKKKLPGTQNRKTAPAETARARWTTTSFGRLRSWRSAAWERDMDLKRLAQTKETPFFFWVFFFVIFFCVFFCFLFFFGKDYIRIIHVSFCFFPFFFCKHCFFLFCIFFLFFFFLKNFF